MTNKVLDELKNAYSFLRNPMLKLAIDRIEELEKENEKWQEFGNRCLEDLSKATNEIGTTVGMLKEREETIETLKMVCKKQNDLMGKMSHTIDELADLAGIEPPPYN